MKIGSVEVPEFEVTGITGGDELVIPGLPTDGSLGLAVLVPGSGVTFTQGYDRFFIAFTGGGRDSPPSREVVISSVTRNGYLAGGWAYFV